MRARAEVPSFPQRRRAVVDPVAPGGVRALRGDPVGQVAVAAAGQLGEQELRSQCAGVEVVALDADLPHETGHDRVHLVRRHHVERERQEVVRLPVPRVGRRHVRVRAQERRVEGITDARRRRPVAPGIGVLAEDVRDLSHGRDVRVGVRRAGQGRILGAVPAVAGSEVVVERARVQTTRRAPDLVLDVLANVGVVRREDVPVAVALVHPPRNQHVRRIPRRRLAGPPQPPAVVRRDARHEAVRALTVPDVAQPLLVEPPHVELEHVGLGHQLRVAGPAVLLVHRRVGGDAVGVVENGAPGQVTHRLEQRLGARPVSDRGEVGVDDPAVEVLDGRRAGPAGHLDVLEALVGVARLPLLGLGAPGEHVLVGLEAAGDETVGGHEVAGGVQRFAVAQGDLGAARALHTDPRPARDVARQVKHVHAGAR